MFVQQYFVGAGEMPAPEECAACERAGMRSFQHKVAGSIDKVSFIAGESSPKEEYHAVAII
jgi:hypothetical protein